MYKNTVYIYPRFNVGLFQMACKHQLSFVKFLYIKHLLYVCTKNMLNLRMTKDTEIVSIVFL